MINISTLLTNDCNIIEIYILNSRDKNKEVFKRNIYLDDEYLNKIKSKFKLTKETTYVYFNRNNLSYVYDNTNDSQYVFLRKLENIEEKNQLFALAFNEMKMQTHSFACTNDINNKVISKTYEYRILNRNFASALDRGVHFYPGKLDWDRVREALPYFVGEKDFKAFQGAKAEVKTTVRRVHKLQLLNPQPDLYVFEIEGSGFLKHMVRNIVGTLLEVGEGKISPSEIPEIIQSLNRRKAGRTAPPEGLYLAKVVYPEQFGLN